MSFAHAISWRTAEVLGRVEYFAEFSFALLLLLEFSAASWAEHGIGRNGRRPDQ
jgi:hypothetical protein